MGISPMYVGQNAPIWQETWLDENGVAINLTGAVVSLTLVNTQTGAAQAGAGVMTIATVNPGVTLYAWSSADTAIAGDYLLFRVAYYPLTNQTLYVDPIPWKVLPVAPVSPVY